MIRIENLSKDFSIGKEKLTAVNNVNLNIKQGEIFGIIGLSGAGKSTLIRCINRLEEPTSGRIISQVDANLFTVRTNVGSQLCHYWNLCIVIGRKKNIWLNSKTVIVRLWIYG